MKSIFEILIVDDNEGLVQNISDILEGSGYKTATALDGLAAIKLGKNEHFDLAIVDIKLPDIDGLELIENLSKLNQAMEFIIVTGHGSIESAVNAVKEKRIVSYELKPVDMNHLLSLIQQITERKQAEFQKETAFKALWESEDKYRYLFENNVIGVGISDWNGKVFEVNDAMCKLTGYNREECFKTNVGLTFADSEDEEELFKILKNEGKIRDFEVQLYNKKKEKYWCSLNVKPIEYAGDPALLATATNITERKQAEKALKESEIRFRTFIEQAGDSMFLADFNGNIIDVNNCTCERLGYTRDELLSMHLGDLAPSYMNEDNRKMILSELTSQGVITIESEYKQKDGKKIPVEIRINIIEIEGEKVMLGFARDITERKQAEEALLASEERFKSLMQQSPFVIEIYDLNGLQISVNKAYEELWDFPAETTLNQFNILKSKEVEDTGLMEYVKRAYAGESVTVPEYIFDPTGNTEAKGVGRVRWLSTKIYPLKEKFGKTKNIVVTHQDITKRNNAEKKIKKQLLQLEQMNSNFIGRELKMIELKSEINTLLEKLGETQKYDVPFVKEKI